MDLERLSGAARALSIGYFSCRRREPRRPADRLSSLAAGRGDGIHVPKPALPARKQLEWFRHQWARLSGFNSSRLFVSSHLVSSRLVSSHLISSGRPTHPRRRDETKTKRKRNPSRRYVS